MLTYVQKLTLQPVAMTEGDVQTLRHTGFSDAAIGDVAANAALFAFMNRIVDGLGCSLPRGWDAQARRLGVSLPTSSDGGAATDDRRIPRMGDDDDEPER